MVVLEDGLASDYFKGEAHEQNSSSWRLYCPTFRKGDRSDDPDGGSNRQFEDNYVDLSKVINMEIDEEE